MRVHALPEAQFCLEIGVIGVCEGHVAGGQQRDEDLDDLRVELCARDAVQLRDRRLAGRPACGRSRGRS